MVEYPSCMGRSKKRAGQRELHCLPSGSLGLLSEIEKEDLEQTCASHPHLSWEANWEP